MRSPFSAHLNRENKNIKEIWGSAYFCFDTNTLLNMYRYSENTRKEFLSVLNQLRERLWLPEQASLEFFKNRLPEISTQVKSYETTKSKITDLRGELMKSRGHPHVSDKTMEIVNDAFKVLEQELENNKEQHLSRVNSDDILEELAELFKGRIGGAYSDADLNKILEDGAIRMASEIPPGYKDFPKHKVPIDSYQRRANFGDYIVFKQTIDLSNQSQLPVILVTGDSKEDWWLKALGRTVGARPELVEEFYAETGQEFMLYDPEQFLRYAKEHLQSTVSLETLEEVKENSSSDGFLSSAFRTLLDDAMMKPSEALGLGRANVNRHFYSMLVGNSKYPETLKKINKAVINNDHMTALDMSNEAIASIDAEMNGLERYLDLFHSDNDSLSEDAGEHISQVEDRIAELKRYKKRIQFYKSYINDIFS